MTLAVAGLALFGTCFRSQDGERGGFRRPSAGWSLMSSIALIGLVIVLEARPVYSYLSAQAFGEPSQPMEMILGFDGRGGLRRGNTRPH
jgi:hypothetical protein